MGLAILIFFVALISYSGWKVCTRAGFQSWLGFAFLFPVLNVFLLFYLAEAEWPIDKQNINQF